MRNRQSLFTTFAVVCSMLAGVASTASATAKEEATPTFCEQDRCVFGFAFCENAEWQKTGCNTGVTGLCSQYDCKDQ